MIIWPLSPPKLTDILEAILTSGESINTQSKASVHSAWWLISLHHSVHNSTALCDTVTLLTHLCFSLFLLMFFDQPASKKKSHLMNKDGYKCIKEKELHKMIIIYFQRRQHHGCITASIITIGGHQRESLDQRSVTLSRSSSLAV